MKLGTSSPLAHESAEEWAAKHRSLGLEAINFHLTCEDDPSLVDEYVKKAGIVRSIYESKKYANTCLYENKRFDYQHMY